MSTSEVLDGERITWRTGVRAFRAPNGDDYFLRIRRGWFGWLRGVELDSTRGTRWSRSRGELLALGGARFLLPKGGGTLDVVVEPGRARVVLDGRPVESSIRPIDPATWIDDVQRALRRTSGVELAAAFLALVVAITVSTLAPSVALGVALVALGRAALRAPSLVRRWRSIDALATTVLHTPSRIEKVSLARTREWLEPSGQEVVVHTREGAALAMVVKATDVESIVRMLQERARGARLSVPPTWPPPRAARVPGDA